MKSETNGYLYFWLVLIDFRIKINEKCDNKMNKMNKKYIQFCIVYESEFSIYNLGYNFVTIT
jgi:ABC-type transport system involved in Fe-S cluster assembly fused permease/ATPase subunit